MKATLAEQYWPFALAGLVYLGIGFRFCKFWMVQSATHPERCRWYDHDGCDWNFPAALLSVPLWPLHFPILAIWGFGWCIYKPFAVMWNQTKEQVKRDKEAVEIAKKREAEISAHPIVRHVSHQYVGRMNEDEFNHWMNCEECRGKVGPHEREKAGCDGAQGSPVRPM